VRGKFTSGAVGGAANIGPPARLAIPPFVSAFSLFPPSPERAAAVDRLPPRTASLVRSIAGLNQLLLSSVLLTQVLLSQVLPSQILVNNVLRCAVGAARHAGFGDLHV